MVRFECIYIRRKWLCDCVPERQGSFDLGFGSSYLNKHSNYSVPGCCLPSFLSIFHTHKTALVRLKHEIANRQSRTPWPRMQVARIQSLEMLPSANTITHQSTLRPINSMFVDGKNRFLINSAMIHTIAPIKPTERIRLPQLFQMPCHCWPIVPLCVHKIVQHARLVYVRQHV